MSDNEIDLTGGVPARALPAKPLDDVAVRKLNNAMIVAHHMLFAAGVADNNQRQTFPAV